MRNTSTTDEITLALERRFEPKQIERIKELITNENKDIALELINTEYQLGTPGRARFNQYEIADILSKINKHNKEYVMELVNSSYSNGRSRFAASDISNNLSLRNNNWFDKIENSQLKLLRTKFGDLGFLDGTKIDDEVLADLDQRISLIKDSRIKDYIETELKRLSNNDIFKKNSLQEISDLANAINTRENSYSVYKTDRRNKSDMAKFNDFIKTKNIKNIDEITSNETAPAEIFGKNNKRLKADLNIENKLFALRQYCKNYPDSEMANYLYTEKYLKVLLSKNPDNELLKNAVEKAETINKNYNVKIFLGRNRLKYADEVLNYVEKELSLWQKASNGTAKLPPVIDFSSAKQNWYNSKSAYNTTASSAYCESRKSGSIAVSLMSLDKIKYVLRHEMTHVNDLKRGYKIPKQYNLNEIMPHKNENGVVVIDFENCKFKEEFLNASISKYKTKYAYNNTTEFIAVAAEGDMSKYSPEFKNMLIDFGMPQGVFNLPPHD